MTSDRKWALILGVSSGFGAATARRLAEAGWDILGVHLDRRSTMPAAEALQAETAARGKANAVRIGAEAEAARIKIEAQGLGACAEAQTCAQSDDDCKPGDSGLRSRRGLGTHQPRLSKLYWALPPSACIMRLVRSLPGAASHAQPPRRSLPGALKSAQTPKFGRRGRDPEI